MPAAPIAGSIISALAAAVGTGVAIKSANDQKKAARKSLEQQQQANKEQKALAQQELNKENQESYDSSSALAAQQAATGGIGNQSIVGNILSAQKDQQKKNILGA